MARIFTSRFARTARLSARNGLRKRSPAIRLLLQSGDRSGGAAGMTMAGFGAMASYCGWAAIGIRITRLARAHADGRKDMKSPLAPTLPRTKLRRGAPTRKAGRLPY